MYTNYIAKLSRNSQKGVEKISMVSCCSALLLQLSPQRKNLLIQLFEVKTRLIPYSFICLHVAKSVSSISLSLCLIFSIPFTFLHFFDPSSVDLTACPAMVPQKLYALLQISVLYNSTKGTKSKDLDPGFIKYINSLAPLITYKLSSPFFWSFGVLYYVLAK